MKKLINYLNELLKKEKKIIIFNIIIFLVGLIFGSLFINFIGNADKKILVDEVGEFFTCVKTLDKSIFGLGAFESILINNIIQITIIFILGISMIGIFAVILILFFKGFTTGLTIGTIIYKYSLKGILGSLLYIFPCHVAFILIYLFLSFFSVYVSIKFLKSLLTKKSLDFKTFIGRYFLAFIISLVLIITISLVDAYITPVLLKLFTFLI